MALFSKRHYEAIAKAMLEAKREIEAHDDPSDIILAGWEHALEELTASFARDNAAFDSLRFTEACGTLTKFRAEV